MDTATPRKKRPEVPPSKTARTPGATYRRAPGAAPTYSVEALRRPADALRGPYRAASWSQNRSRQISLDSAAAQTSRTVRRPDGGNSFTRRRQRECATLGPAGRTPANTPPPGASRARSPARLTDDRRRPTPPAPTRPLPRPLDVEPAGTDGVRTGSCDRAGRRRRRITTDPQGYRVEPSHIAKMELLAPSAQSGAPTRKMDRSVSNLWFSAASSWAARTAGSTRRRPRR